MSNPKNRIIPYTIELMQYTDDELRDKARYYITSWDQNLTGRIEIRDFYYVYNELLMREKEPSNCSSCHEGPINELRYYLEDFEKSAKPNEVSKTPTSPIISTSSTIEEPKIKSRRGRKKKDV